ncbi:hypothetical protein AVEN_88649-1 [Araneus ventricosus]|uniref:Uncharacterized protein n=1 Tax=Araneus ventricosus TaxID=182803 RepID=A0A4Y2UWK2_ARAVE|nr:hypothetical protein AVEN_88649-1 [Araneus ventricosus]
MTAERSRPLTLATILATWRQIWRQIEDFRKCNDFLDISIRRGDTRMCYIIPCDVTTSRASVYKRRANAFEERLWSFVCSASWKADELSAIESTVTVISDLLTVCVSKSESAVTVITSELLSVCVANLYKSYCSSYLCYVFFSCSFVNKPSLSCVLNCLHRTHIGQF